MTYFSFVFLGRRMHSIRRVQFLEKLEDRLFFAQHTAATLASDLNQEIKIDAGDATPTSIVLTNESEFDAEFTMRFNGNISVNLQDLVQQIRDWQPEDLEGKPDYARAYHYMLEYHQHDFPLSGQTWMHEPSLYLNSFGAGFCDDSASALAMIWRGMGYESRVWLLRGHVVSEVFADGKWQMFDADLQVVYQNRAGEVASVEELATNTSLIRTPHVRDAENPFVYSSRIARIYASRDNAICTGCDKHTVGRDLIFELPPGGTLEWGSFELDRDLPTVQSGTIDKVGQIKLTVPEGFTGDVDIPLALYDVRGMDGDIVTINGNSFSVHADGVFEMLNEDTRIGNRIQTLSFAETESPVEILYFFNEQFLEIESSNLIEIDHRTPNPAQLTASLKHAEGGWAVHTAFSGQEYLDLAKQHVDVASIVDGETEFSVESRISIEPGTSGSRRPIFDTFRFSLEIDDQNRPYVYFRGDNDRWVKLRGSVLAEGIAHDIQVTYRLGQLEMLVNGDALRRSAPRMSSDYPINGSFIGKSNHLNGLYFHGEIHRLTIQRLGAVVSAELPIAVVTELDFDPELPEETAPEDTVFEVETHSPTPIAPPSTKDANQSDSDAEESLREAQLQLLRHTLGFFR